MAKIFVVGGSGRVASELIKNLINDGNQVFASSRHPEKIIKLDNVVPVKLDLHSDVSAWSEVFKGMDVIYFVAGSRGKDLLQTDAMGAVKTMQAAENVGVKRYIMLSSLYALQPEKWSQYESLAALTDYNIAKFFADNYLVNDTKLDYTVVQPASLTEETGTGRVSFNEIISNTNPIPDVAKVLAEVIKHNNTIGKVIMMCSGDNLIETALKDI